MPKKKFGEDTSNKSSPKIQQEETTSVENKENIVKEFSEEELALVKSVNEEFLDKIEIRVSKDNGEFEFKLIFGEHTSYEIAEFLKQILDAGMPTIIQMALIQLGNIDSDMLEKVVNSYNKIIEKDSKKQKKSNDKLIMRPWQVFSGK